MDANETGAAAPQPQHSQPQQPQHSHRKQSPAAAPTTIIVEKEKTSPYSILLQRVKMTHWFAKGEGGTLYNYRDGAYLPDDEYSTELGKLVKLYMGGLKIDPIHEDEYFNKIKNHLLRDSRLIWTKPPVDEVNLVNGILDLRTMELAPHAPDRWISPTQVPVEWKPEAKCPKWDQFLLDLFPVDYLPFIHEVIGFCLTPKALSQTAIWLKGTGGSNGKSTLVLAISRLIGERNFLSIDIHDLDQDRFIPAMLSGKLMVTDLDARKKALDSTNIFKKIIAGDPFTAQKKQLHPFTLHPFCKMIYCGNHEPFSDKDRSGGFNRRFIQVPMDRQFKAGEKGYRGQGELLDSLSTAEELSGLLNHAIAGWKRLDSNKQFSLPEAVVQSTKEFQYHNSPFNTYREERVYLDSTSILPKKKLLHSVNEWMVSNHYSPLTEQMVGRYMKFFYPDLGTTRLEGENAYVGVNLSA